MNYKKYILLSTMALGALTASASKAISTPVQVTLDDGESVTVRLVGDEHVNFYLTNDNEMVIADGTRYHRASREEQDSINTLLYARRDTGQPSGNKLTAATEGGSEAITTTRHLSSLGTPRIPVILLSYSDKDFTLSREEISEIFNSDKINTVSPYTKQPQYFNSGSVAEYFNACSNGKFRPQFDIIGPVKSTHACTWFSSRSTSRTTEACQYADDIGTDFSQYDNDNDGYVDLVIVLCAGMGSNRSGNNSRYVYPHFSTISGTTIDGKNIYNHLQCNELFGQESSDLDGTKGEERLSIGVLIHEMAHAMGLKDTYPTIDSWQTEDYDNQSMENWDLMDNGENLNMSFSPTPFSAWQRALFGWTDPIKPLTTPQDVTLTPLCNDGEAVMVQNDEDKSEYYILENLPDASNPWYSGMPNNGMLVTHVQYSQSAFSSSSPNNTKGHPRYTIIPADGSLLTSYRYLDYKEGDAGYISRQQYFDAHKGDVYPGTENVTSLTDYKAYTGIIDKPITDIRMLANGDVTFRFMGGATAADAITSAEGTAPTVGKVMKNGKITIIRNNKEYNTLGISL